MSSYKQLKLIYIYILAIANCILLIVHCGRQFYSDTLSYLIAWDNISNGQIDKWRTPLYPLFLGSWLAINFKCLFKRNTTWEKIEHVRDIKIKEIA